MASIGSMMIDIGANVARLQTDMNNAVGIVSKSAKQMEDAFASVKSAAEMVGTVLGVSLGAAGVGAVIAKSISTTTQWASEVNNLSKVMGTSTQDASDYNVALRLIGKTSDDAETAMFKLVRTMRTHPEVLDELKVAYKGANGEMLSGQQVFQNAIDVTKQYKVGIDQDIVSMALFGKGAKEMTDFQKLNSDIMERARTLARQYHLEMDENGVAAARNYKIEINALGIAMEGIYHQIGENLLPVMQQLVESLASKGPAAAKAFSDALSGLIGVMSAVNALPGQMGDAVEAGIVLRIITGSWGPLKVMTALAGIDSAIKSIRDSLNMDFKSPFEAITQDWKNAWQAFEAAKKGSEGMRDFFKNMNPETGEPLVGRTHVTGKLPEAPAPIGGKSAPADLFGVGAGKTLSGTDLIGSTAAIAAKLAEVKKMFSDMFDDIQIELAKMQGDTLKAEYITIDKWGTDTAAKVNKMIAEAQTKYDEMTARVAKTGGDASAIQAQAKAQKDLNDVRDIGTGILNTYIPQEQSLKRLMADNKDAQAIAAVNVTYAELTGTMQQQLQAQIALIEAERKGKDGVSELGQAYKKYHDEQERIANLRANGSLFDGMNEGARQWKNSLSTIADQGINLFKNTLPNAIDTAAGALADFTMTGKMNFSNFANSIVKDILKMAYTAALNSAVSGIFSMLGIGASTGSTGGAMDISKFSLNIPGIDVASGKAGGGDVYPGNIYPVGEKGPELFAPKSAGTIIPNNRLGGGGSLVVQNNISVTTQGSGQGGGQMDKKQMEALARTIAIQQEAATNEAIRKQMRPGGMLNRGLN